MPRMGLTRGAVGQPHMRSVTCSIRVCVGRGSPSSMSPASMPRSTTEPRPGSRTRGRSTAPRGSTSSSISSAERSWTPPANGVPARLPREPIVSVQHARHGEENGRGDGLDRLNPHRGVAPPGPGCTRGRLTLSPMYWPRADPSSAWSAAAWAGGASPFTSCFAAWHPLPHELS